MIDYKTIISTTDSKVTLMQWLQALTEEFGDAKIKSVTFDVSTTRLSLTIQKEDGTAFTTTQVLYSLTADEQSLINNLIKSVTASSDGVTFGKAVSFQGNESHNGSEIHNGYASFLGDENHAGSEMHKGTATFTDLRSDDLTATDGQELVSWDGTTTALKGKADRPTYNGGDLALKSDIGDVPMVTFMANLGIGRWRNISLYHFTWESYETIYDGLASNYTDCRFMFSNSKFIDIFSSSLSTGAINFNSVNFFNPVCSSFNGFFNGFQNACEILLPNMTNTSNNFTCAFFNSKFTKINLMDAAKVYIYNGNWAFYNCVNLTEIGAIDMTYCITLNYAFFADTKLTALHCTHWKVSFSLAQSSLLSESAVVEIFNNLDVVSPTQSITLNAAVYDLLSTADIAIATGKGWAVARAS